jgi:hypothetical protein
LRTASALAALLACSGAPVALARAETTIGSEFRPDSLGASTALTLRVGLSGAEEVVPAPLRGMVVHLPAGLGIHLQGVARCSRARLQSRGAAGCSSRSRVGHGQAVLEVHAGSQTVPEEATVSAFRGPDLGGRPSLLIYGKGDTPLDESTISTGVLRPDRAPYGSQLRVSIPPIPTLVYEPDASILSMSLTIGRAAGAPKARAGAGEITVPHRCPRGGFPFAAEFTFADQSTASARATAPCP